MNPGLRFWLVLYPRTITSLRHAWTHPAFEPTTVPETRPSKFKELQQKSKAINEASEEWLREWFDGNGLEHDRVMGVIKGEHGADGWIENDSMLAGDNGSVINIPPEFWNHVENILGPQDKKPDYFTCSC